MRAPRVRVGLISRGNSPALNLGDAPSTTPNHPTTSHLAELLSSHGHEVIQLTDLHDIPHLEVIVLHVQGEALSTVAEEIASSIRPGQVVIHTSAENGIQILDPVEIRGAVVVAAYPVAPNLWVSTTVDELGATVAELFFGGLGARVAPLAEEDRPDFLAALQRAQNLQRQNTQAAQWLSRYLPDSQAVASLLTPTAPLPTDHTDARPSPHHLNPLEAQ